MMNPSSSESSMISPLMGLFIPRSLRTSPIDEILNKPDPKLEDLLDDDSFSYELKNCNPKLMDYFTKNRENIKHLIDYITQMPPDENDKKRAFKYPFLVCEIFESDITPLMNAFFLNMRVGKGNDAPLRKREISDDYEVVLSNDSAESADQENKISSEFKKQEHEDYVEVSEAMPKAEVKRKELQNKKKLDTMSLMDYLFAFIHVNDQLNPVLSGYFSKLVLALFKKNSTKMVEYVYQNSDNLHRMVYHLGDRSMAELLSVFLTYETLHFEERRQQITEIKIEIIGEIFKYLIDSKDSELIANSGYILTDILLKSDASIDGKEMLHKITTPEHFNLLFQRFKTQDNEIINHFGTIIYSLISFYTPRGYHFDPHSGEEPKIDEKKVNQDPVLAILIQQFPLFIEILSKEESEEIKTSFGAKTKLLGSAKLRVIELIHRIIRIKSSKLHQKLYNSKLLNLVTQVFFRFQWNNILHDTYERLVKTIIERGSSILYDALFIGANFLSLLIQEAKDPNYILPKNGRKVRKGNMGHVFRIINFLVEHSKKNDKLQKYFSKLSEWSTFLDTTLAENNAFNSIEDFSSKLKDHPSLSRKEKSLSKLSKDQGFGEIAPSDKDVLAKMPTGFVSVSITRDELDKKSVIDLGFTTVENEIEENADTVNLDDVSEMPKKSHLERKYKTQEEERSNSSSPSLESQKEFQPNRSSHTPSTSPKKKDPNAEKYFGGNHNFNEENEIFHRASIDGKDSNPENKKIVFKPKAEINNIDLISGRKSEPANLRLFHSNSTDISGINPNLIKSTGGLSSIGESSKNLKVKVKIKKGEKDDPKKILEKIGQIGRPETNSSKMNNSEDYGADPNKLDYVIAPDNISDELVLGHSDIIGNSK